MCGSSKATSSPIRGCGSGRIAVGNTVVRNVRRKDRHTQLERSRPSAALPSLGGAHRSAGGGDRRGGQRFDRRVGGARRAGVSVGYVAPAAGKLRFRRRLQPRVRAVGGRLLGAAQLRCRTCGGVVGAADRGARRAARRGCRGAETALLRRARPVRVCGCCGRIHRLVRFPVLSGTYPADVGKGSGAVRRHPRCLLGERCGLLLPCGGIPPHGRFRRRLLRPHGGDRPLLADAVGGVVRARRPPKQGVAFGRRHVAERFAAQTLPQLPQQPRDALQVRVARAACRGGCAEAPCGCRRSAGLSVERTMRTGRCGRLRLPRFSGAAR